MATTLKTKNSVTAASAPSSLAQGELAVNITDKKLWVGNAATTPVQLLGTGADGFFTNLTVANGASIQGLTVGRGSGAVASNTAFGGNALASNTTGTDNTAYGLNALRYAVSTNNTAFGSGAIGAGATTGVDNTALGRATLYNVSSGQRNVAVGSNALFTNTTGQDNVAIGLEALYTNSTYGNNTMVGFQAGKLANSTSNTFIGYAAGQSVTSGDYSTLVGAVAGGSLTTGRGNTFVGSSYAGGVGSSMTTGSYNTIIGGYTGTSGSLNLTSADYTVVLSAGDGTAYAYINNGPQWYLRQAGNSSYWKALKQTYMGYSNSYGALQIGSPDQNQTICMGIDAATITGGSFSGSGTEMLWRRTFAFIIPDGAGTNFQTLMSWAGQSVTIAGSLSKGSGSFRIDHPLPELEPTHQLVHSFIEGPQADLIYRGVVDLVNGKATVNIDTAAGMTEGTFEVLCREVQCFTTNESDWVAVRGKVAGNILTIEAQDVTATSTISWMVIGERKDKHMMDTEWTDDNGKVIVEPAKPPVEARAEEVTAKAE